MAKTAGVIPTRRGSKGLPGKCMIEVGGHSLIHHAVRQALRTCGSAFVITDDLDHAAEARRAGGHAIVVDYQVPDDAMPEQQERRGMGMFPELFEGFESVCRLFVTHPLRADGDILGGLVTHERTGQQVVSVSESWHQEHQLVGPDGEGRWVMRHPNPRRPRQYVPPPENYLVGCFYVSTMESYLQHAFWPPLGFLPYFVPALRSLDVDDAHDLARVRALWPIRDRLL